MKKLLVLTLVLGLCGAASAAISLSPAGATVNVGEPITISVVSDTTNSYGGWLDLTQNLGGTWGDLQILPAAGPDATKDFSFDPWWSFEAKSFNPAAPIEIGTHFTVDYTAGDTEGTFTVGLYEFDGTTLIEEATITVVPEPMTLGLLGLGGLFLRRRR